MSWTDVILIALTNLKQAKLRFALTSLGVLIAITTLVAMVSFGAGLRQETIGNLETREILTSFRVLGPRQAQMLREREAESRNPAEAPSLDDALVERLAGLPGVVNVQPEIRLPVQMLNGEKRTLAVVRGAGRGMAHISPYSKITAGRFLQEANELVLSRRLARNLGFDPPEAAVGVTIVVLTDRLQKNAGEDDLPFETVQEEFTVVGVLPYLPGTRRSPFLDGSVMSVDKAQQIWKESVSSASLSNIIATEQGRNRDYEAIDVQVQGVQDLEKVRKEIESWGAATFSISDEIGRLKEAFLILETILSVLGMIALVVASLGIANVLIMSVVERTQVIGIMKAIGGRNSDVRRIFLVEAGLIGLTGGILGIAGGWALTRLGHFFLARHFLNQGLAEVPDLFAYPLWLIAGALVFSLLFSIASGLLPANRAARVDPIQALRRA
jgi:putative ABC transport system permease protein